MRYNVRVSELASEQYDKFLDYIYHILLNPQAAEALMQDFDEAVNVLEKQAESFGYCKSERLRRHGFRKIHLRCHKYLLVYRVKQDNVVIEGMYHELQDYENTIG